MRLDLKVQVGWVISDIECRYKEIADREPQFPDQSSNRVKAMCWGVFVWKLYTRWNWVGQSRGQLQVVDVPHLKDPQPDSFSPDFMIYFKLPFWGSHPSIPYPSSKLSMARPLSLRLRVSWSSSILSYPCYSYPSNCIHTDNLTHSFHFNSVLGIIPQTSVACVLASPSMLPVPSFRPVSFLIWLTSASSIWASIYQISLAFQLINKAHRNRLLVPDRALKVI